MSLPQTSQSPCPNPKLEVPWRKGSIITMAQLLWWFLQHEYLFNENWTEIKFISHKPPNSNHMVRSNFQHLPAGAGFELPTKRQKTQQSVANSLSNPHPTISRTHWCICSCMLANTQSDYEHICPLILMLWGK